MNRKIPERDWKYLRKLQPEMLDALCARINQQAIQLLQSTKKTEHEKYLELYRHVNDSDRIVADCFNDWSRSNIWLKILPLRRHGLLTDEHVSQLSEESSELIKVLDS